MSEEKNTAALQPKAKEKTKNMATIQKKEGRTVMYVGPTIRNVVAAGSLYSNGLPEKLKKEMEKQPLIKELVVPVERLAEVKKELAIPGSGMAIIYGKIITG